MDMFKKKRHAPIKTIPGIAISEPGAAGVHGQLSPPACCCNWHKMGCDRIIERM